MSSPSTTLWKCIATPINWGKIEKSNQKHSLLCYRRCYMRKGNPMPAMTFSYFTSLRFILSVWLSIRLSACVCPRVHLSVYLIVCVCVCMCVSVCPFRVYLNNLLYDGQCPCLLESDYNPIYYSFYNRIFREIFFPCVWISFIFIASQVWALFLRACSCRSSRWQHTISIRYIHSDNKWKRGMCGCGCGWGWGWGRGWGWGWGRWTWTCPLSCKFFKCYFYQ